MSSVRYVVFRRMDSSRTRSIKQGVFGSPGLFIGIYDSKAEGGGREFFQAINHLVHTLFHPIFESVKLYSICLCFLQNTLTSDNFLGFSTDLPQF